MTEGAGTEELDVLGRLADSGGAIGALLAEVDWAATPVGPPAGWPSSLRTAVDICLSSGFPMLVWWGPDLVNFYNDAYTPSLGSKHPASLGQRASECWAEAWDELGPLAERVLAGQGATYSEDLLLLLERHGYLEETYWTFSYGPIRDETGGVGGVLIAVTETTAQVVSGRRLDALRSLAAATQRASSVDEVMVAAASVLGHERPDVPFATLALLGDGDVLRPVASSGPSDVVDLAAANGAIAAAAAEALDEHRTVVVDGLGLACGDLVVDQVLVIPLEASGVTGVMVAAVNPCRALDDAYRSFYGLTGSQVTTALSSAMALQTERARAEALAELDAAKTTFFSNVSHELRTPLTLMLGPLGDVLADVEEPLPPAQRRRLEMVERNTARLLKLVNSLLDFSRLEAGHEVARYSPVDLGEVTEELALTFGEAADQAGLTIALELGPLSEPVFVDRGMWDKIVLNLVANALKFTFTGGITVRVAEVEGAAELTVADTGVGIESVELPRLFERFHRVATTQGRTHEGTGIGLALVRELAERHGGSVSVTSTVGVGSAFTVRVPLGSSHLPPGSVVAETGDASGVAARARELLAEAAQWLVEPDPWDQVAPPGPDRPRVLVVDDNADMRAYLAGLLSHSYAVETAPDGAAGLARATAHPPDLVLTDVMMPQLDGFGLLAALRVDPLTAHVPVVMVSARAGEEAVVEGLDAGADDYLVKPFSARELLARVRANLELERARRQRGRDEALLAELEANQAMLDHTQRLAKVGSWSIDLRTDEVEGSSQLHELLQTSPEELRSLGLAGALRYTHPDDRDRVAAGVAAALDSGRPLDDEIRVIRPDGTVRVHRLLGVVDRDDSGTPVVLHGSLQDVSDERKAEEARRADEAAREAAALEHRIADELQRSLLPASTFDLDHLEVGTYYRPGVAGSQVGGDWYDVIELSAGRSALVIGDVMGRGVAAAAVMGQLRAAVRAYARLDLPPADVLELLDAAVGELGADHIVTCIYAVYDPADRSLTYANAGHLPPLLATGEGVRRLCAATGAPLGTQVAAYTEDELTLPSGAMLLLYTDGVVERRDRDLDVGIDGLAACLGASLGEPVAALPAALVGSLGVGPDDDMAVLVAQVLEGRHGVDAVTAAVTPDAGAVHHARQLAAAALESWELPEELRDSVVLLVSELVTNAVVHGRPPISLRLRRTDEGVVLEVRDGATSLPRRMRPTVEDEHGRGLQLVAVLADRWGVRPTASGKSVWCLLLCDARS